MDKDKQKQLAGHIDELNRLQESQRLDFQRETAAILDELKLSLKDNQTTE
ncbi:MAG: hypothetical protein WCO55_00130 [Candidatus Falkowbacteria bacterium]